MSRAQDRSGPGALSEARNRLEMLADPQSFLELGSQARHQVTAFDMQRRRPLGDGVVTGVGRIDDRPVALFAQDPTALGGSLGETHASKIQRVMDWSARSRMPVDGRELGRPARPPAVGG